MAIYDYDADDLEDFFANDDHDNDDHDIEDEPWEDDIFGPLYDDDIANMYAAYLNGYTY